MPSVEYFARWLRHDPFVIEQHEHYQKRTWRNKTVIQSANGLTDLVVPLTRGKNQQKPIRDVQIAYDMPWVDKHLQALQSAYGRTAFFEEVYASIAPVLQHRHQTLWNLDLQLLEVFTTLLGGKWPLHFTEEYAHQVNPNTIDLRSGICGGQFTFRHPVELEYAQVQRLGNSFLPNLSILDTLCHLGPGTADYLRQVADCIDPHPHETHR